MSAAMETTRYPGVYRRGGRYVYVWRDVSGRQHKRSAVTVKEAVAKRGKELDRARRGARVADASITFTEYASEWIVGYVGRTARGVGPETLADYAKALGLAGEGRPLDPPSGAVEFFGRIRLAEIGPRGLRAYVARIAKTGVARNTIRLRLAPVKALLATAHEDELIEENPAAGLRNLLPATDTGDTDDEHVKALDARQLVALLDELPDGWRLFFEFLAEMGLRISEAIELRFRDLENLDVEVGARWLRVQRRYYRGRVARPKGRKTRKLRLTAEMASALRELRDERQAGEDDLVFPAERGGRIAPSNLARRVLKPAAARAGIGRFVEVKGSRTRKAETWVAFHTFRHTCATRLIVEEGWSLEHVQEFLGHSSYEITRRFYVHLLPDDQREQRSVRGGNRVATTPADIAQERRVREVSG